MYNMNKNGKAPSKAELNAILEKNGLGAGSTHPAQEEHCKPSEEPTLIINLEQTQKLLGVCRATMYANFLSDPSFPHFKRGGRVFVDYTALQKWINEQTTQAVAVRSGCIQ